MERRLLKAIMMPAMIATWIFGFVLVMQGGWLRAGWLHAKLALVLAMTGMHGAIEPLGGDFAADRNRASPEILSVLSMRYRPF